MPLASGSQPPVSTRVKRRSVPLGLVRDAVAGDAGGVLDDGLAAAEDAVDERGLADVRAADDRQHRQRRQVGDGVGVLAGGLEDVEVALVELVVVEAGAQRGGALRGELLVEVGEALDEVVVAFEVSVVVCQSWAPAVGYRGALSRSARPR